MALPGNGARLRKHTLPRREAAGSGDLYAMTLQVDTHFMSALSSIKVDLLLLHAPAVFDFRERGDLWFPFLSTAGDVPITPLYEYFPMGFRSLRSSLREAGHEVRILNLATLLLRYPFLDLDPLLDRLETPLIGMDLHWMVHVQGVLELARRIRRRKPECRILLGGISATWYAEELVRRPEIDFVLRGYDTHEPLRLLMEVLQAGRRPDEVPNLLWKTGEGQVLDNGMSHKPAAWGRAMDWSEMPAAPPGDGLPFREVLSIQNTGCAYDCHWCGGSRSAFRRIHGEGGSVVYKSAAETRRELESLKRMRGGEHALCYAISAYNESPEGLREQARALGSAGPAAVNFEQFHLTPEPTLKAMAAANPRTCITLSPESHDREVARRAGRGVYSMEEMEAWITRALDLGIHQVDIWFFIGMPGQDEASVAGTLAYCGQLLQRFEGRRVLPYICPMQPFLDPASTFFMAPSAHGYRLFARTAEEHRRLMLRASLPNRMNYETHWLSRLDIVRLGLECVSGLAQMKRAAGLFPGSLLRRLQGRIADTLEFLPVVHEADSLPDPAERKAALASLERGILQRNREIFFGGVANQAFPLAREVGGRWFDELLWPVSELEAMRLQEEDSANSF